MTYSDLIKVTIIQRQITWKWYNIQLYLQWRTNRKSCMIYRTAPFSMILCILVHRNIIIYRRCCSCAAYAIMRRNVWLQCVLLTLLAARCCRYDAVGPPSRKLWHFAASKRRCLLMAGKDSEIFMTRSLNVTPKTTEHAAFNCAQW